MLSLSIEITYSECIKNEIIAYTIHFTTFVFLLNSTGQKYQFNNNETLKKFNF